MSGCASIFIRKSGSPDAVNALVEELKSKAGTFEQVPCPQKEHITAIYDFSVSDGHPFGLDYRGAGQPFTLLVHQNFDRHFFGENEARALEQQLGFPAQDLTLLSHGSEKENEELLCRVGLWIARKTDGRVLLDDLNVYHEQFNRFCRANRSSVIPLPGIGNSKPGELFVMNSSIMEKWVQDAMR